MKYGLIAFVFLDIALILLIFLQFERIKYLPIMNSRKQISDNMKNQAGYANMSDTEADKHKVVPFRVNEKRRLNDMLAKYIAKQHSEKDTWVHQPVKMKNSTVIIYARINKSGSTTLTSLLSSLSSTNKFLLLTGIGPSVSRDAALTYVQRYMVPHATWKTARLLCGRIKNRGVLMRLMYHEDYTRHGCRVSYFTQVRDPVDRFISRYNYNRDLVDGTEWMHKSSFYSSQQKYRKGDNLTACILTQAPECKYQGVVPRYQRLYRADSQITWFCGSSLSCRALADPTALATALTVLERDFVVVGVLEEMEKTMVVLECLLPDYMKGLNSLWKENQAPQNVAHKTHGAVSLEVREVLKKELGQEYRLYNYIRQRLERQYADCIAAAT